MKYYLGVDIGSISTKGVIINENSDIIANEYLWTEGKPIDAIKQVLDALQAQLPSGVQINAVGVTGSARKLIGVILDAQVVKNEITAHAIGTMTRVPDVCTIFEIGGQDSKIIVIDDGIVTDYAMNTICAAGTGSFLMTQANRLGLKIEELGELAVQSKNPSRIAARCTVFAESDMVHKAQIGHKIVDIVAGICNSVVSNYLNNVGKGKRIKSPIVFQGGVSKNIGVVRAFEEVTGCKVHVDEYGHLMGCLGAAVLAKNSGVEKIFSFDIKDISFETKGRECKKCPNNCEIICVYKSGELLDCWGNRCDRGVV